MTILHTNVYNYLKIVSINIFADSLVNKKRYKSVLFIACAYL